MRSDLQKYIPNAFLFALVAFTGVSAQTPPIGGALYLTPRANSGECLTVTSNSNGASVVVSGCTGASSQEWTFTGGTVTLFGGSMCLDVTNGKNANGALLQIWTCSTNGNPNQQFWYTTDNHFAWTNHGKCVDLTNGNQAAGTRLWDYHQPGGGGGGGGAGSSQQAQLITACKNTNDVVLTFDDGPYIYLNDLSDTITKSGAKGTFFFNGNNYDCIYNSNKWTRVKYAYNAGHQISSHTWSHRDLTTLSSDDIHNQMWLVEQALQRRIGVTPALCVHSKPSAVLWDFDSGDSTGSTIAQSETAYNQLVQRRPSNVLALNHETYSATVYQLVPYAIKVLQNAGYNLVTVAECMGMEPYQTVGYPGTPDHPMSLRGGC